MTTDTKKADEAKTIESSPAGEPARVTKTESGKIALKEPKRDGWTAQQGGTPPEDLHLPGQVFVKDQLPDPDVQRAWGIDPDLQNAGLTVLDGGEALKHPSGPEPSDVVVATGVVSGDLRKPDRMQEPDGTLRTPDGVTEADTSGTTAAKS